MDFESGRGATLPHDSYLRAANELYQEPGCIQDTIDSLSSSSATICQSICGSSNGFQVVPSQMNIWLIQEIVQTGGSVAFALQSALTLMSSMTYYENLGNFDRNGTVQQNFFIQATIPQSYRGLITVTITLLLHITVMGIVIFLFLTQTRFSRVGANWSTVGQLSKGDLLGKYLEISRSLGDGEVREYMKRKRVSNVVVGIDKVDGDLGVFVK